MTSIRLSILGRLFPQGNTHGAINELISCAQHADRLGFERYWLTEHHSCLADSSPEVLLPLMAATTKRLKVGVAGILLNYYPAYKVATTFHLLSTMFPGRIDLGVCRGGTSGAAAEGLAAHLDAGKFEEKNERIRDYLRLHQGWPGDVEAPASLPQHWIVGTGETSMTLAAELDASYCYSLCHSHAQADPATLRAFRNHLHHRTAPGPAPDSGILVAGICSRTDEEAARMLAQHQNPYIIPTMAGSRDTCATELKRLADRFGTSHIVWWDLSPAYEQTLESMALLSEAMGLRA